MGVSALLVLVLSGLGMYQNPECLLFKQSVMRAHLLKCLEEKDMKPFPRKTNRPQQKNKTYMHEDTLLGIQWGIQYSLVNLVWDAVFTSEYCMGYSIHW